ncbi:MAG TPA: helix-turn-helix domain-containing protein [Streptosporangiaceae bacterium]|nr:helix-turn-helix domain-containing protein [Streptosporangiaceae bacterium]
MSLERDAAKLSEGRRPPLKLDDPLAMRAVAHPVRLALLQALGQSEPLTATEAGQIIGESPTTCSFHLRTLAKYGFVEETGKTKGRRRPWRLTHAGFTFPAVHPDPETSLAAGALDQLLWPMMLERIRTMLANRTRFSAEHQSVTSAAETVAYVTIEEAQRLKKDLWTLIDSYRERQESPGRRPPDSIPLELLVFTFPLNAGKAVTIQLEE